MLKLARHSRPLAVLPLLAALASGAPLVSWCSLPWSEVTVEDFVVCDEGVRECGKSCERGCEAPVCAMRCPAPAPTGGERAFCLEGPFAATLHPGPTRLDPPPALAVVPAASPLTEPASVVAPPTRFDAARPHSPPRSLPPPVRGPPSVA
jgi:hypothetical protein